MTTVALGVEAEDMLMMETAREREARNEEALRDLNKEIRNEAQKHKYTYHTK